MYELKKIGNVFTSKFVGTVPSSYEKRIYRAAVSQRLRNTGLVGKRVFPACLLSYAGTTFTGHWQWTRPRPWNRCKLSI